MSKALEREAQRCALVRRMPPVDIRCGLGPTQMGERIYYVLTLTFRVSKTRSTRISRTVPATTPEAAEKAFMPLVMSLVECVREEVCNNGALDLMSEL